VLLPIPGVVTGNGGRHVDSWDEGGDAKVVKGWGSYGGQRMGFQKEGCNPYSRLGLGKLLDKFVHIHVIFVNPRVMGRGVALLSYEILLLFPSAKEFLFQDGFNFPFGGVVNNVRWQFKKIGSMFVGLFIWS